MQKNFAIYRLPGHGMRCQLIECAESNLGIYTELPDLGAERGYVVAPFSPATDTPVVVIRAEMSEEIDIEELLSAHSADVSASVSSLAADNMVRADYEEDFNVYHKAIIDGTLSKIVLARSQRLDGVSPDPLLAFYRAAAQNPDSYVAIFSTSKTGTWLTATPEILLRTSGKEWHTMALAGTRPYSANAEPWDSKNSKEQAIVARYIRQRLQPYAATFCEQPTATLRYGNIEHISTQFSIVPKGDPASTLGEILSSLHPTPAVSGWPQKEAMDLILRQEHCCREYYSGFSGPIFSPSDFSLWVTLRCMKIDRTETTLYAGGGIMSDSNADAEWQETVAKMQAMTSILK